MVDLVRPMFFGDLRPSAVQPFGVYAQHPSYIAGPLPQHTASTKHQAQFPKLGRRARFGLIASVAQPCALALVRRVGNGRPVWRLAMGPTRHLHLGDGQDLMSSACVCWLVQVWCGIGFGMTRKGLCCPFQSHLHGSVDGSNSTGESEPPGLVIVSVLVATMAPTLHAIPSKGWASALVLPPSKLAAARLCVALGPRLSPPSPDIGGLGGLCEQVCARLTLRRRCHIS